MKADSSITAAIVACTHKYTAEKKFLQKKNVYENVLFKPGLCAKDYYDKLAGNIQRTGKPCIITPPILYFSMSGDTQIPRHHVLCIHTITIYIAKYIYIHYVVECISYM